MKNNRFYGLSNQYKRGYKRSNAKNNDIIIDNNIISNNNSIIKNNFPSKGCNNDLNDKKILQRKERYNSTKNYITIEDKNNIKKLKGSLEKNNNSISEDFRLSIEEREKKNWNIDNNLFNIVDNNGKHSRVKHGNFNNTSDNFFHYIK